MKKYEYEVRQIDAWWYDDCWNWNDSYRLGTMKTASEDVGRALTGWLRRKGFSFYKGRTLIEYDGDVYTIIDRKTKCPLFAAIPCF